MEDLFTLRHTNICAVETKLPTKKEFFQKYLSVSRPVILKGAASHWPAISKWTSEYLRKEVGDNIVHVKITPNGEFEGCDDARNWEEYSTRVLPEVVRSKLQFPDTVVVRPAPHDLPFREFMVCFIFFSFFLFLVKIRCVA